MFGIQNPYLVAEFGRNQPALVSEWEIARGHQPVEETNHNEQN